VVYKRDFLDSEVITELIRIVGSERVLIDHEDVYVYSHEKLIDSPKKSNIDVVIRPKSEAEINEIIQLANLKEVNVFLRGKGQNASKSNKFKNGTILLDTCPPADITKFDEKLLEMNKIKREIFDELETESSVIRSARSFFPTLFKIRNLNIYQCQKCDTCSGYCTLNQHFNNIETWSSKGRYLLIKGLMKGELKPSKKLIESIYSCTLCGLCYSQCFNGLNINKAVVSARHYIADLGKAPEQFTFALQNIKNTGNILGSSLSLRNKWIEKLPKNLLKEKADIVYWVGCNAALRPRLHSMAIDTVKALDRANVKVANLREKEICCGLILFFGGLLDEAKENAKKIVEIVTKTGAEILVTSCAGCYEAFNEYYPEFLDIEMPCKILHTSQLLGKLIKKGEINFKELNMKVTYQDPCGLGRHCKVYDEPRTILKAIPNLQFVDMQLSKERSRCCGGGGGLWGIDHNISMNCAYTRLVEDVIPLGVDALVTSCPQCYLTFQSTLQSQLFKESEKSSIKTKVMDLANICSMALTND
jgi:heterodisulfide reductase subunit D